LTLDASPEKRNCVSELLITLVNNEIMSKDQASLGFVRALESAADLSLDIPNAKVLIDEFIGRAISSGILPQNFGSASSASQE
jgi:hypothetical protein